MKTSDPPRSVASYYDQNTLRFLRLGGSGETAAIHRQIWAPGVQTRQQAFQYLNALVATAIHADHPAVDQALDLGCGVGGTATWLAQQAGLCVTGVTNSPVQRDLAAARARRLFLEGRCRFVLADYLDLPPLGPFQAAYAIESFAHARDPQRFFQQATAQLAPGSRLVICDDFLAETSATQASGAQRYLRQFQAGWHIRSLLTGDAVQRLAVQAGLQPVDCMDLTTYQRQLPRPALYPLAWVTRLPLGRLGGAYWENLSGGLALQVCARRGWVRYQALVFEKKHP